MTLRSFTKGVSWRAKLLAGASFVLGLMMSSVVWNTVLPAYPGTSRHRRQLESVELNYETKVNLRPLSSQLDQFEGSKSTEQTYEKGQSRGNNSPEDPFNEIRILCMVITSPQTLDSRSVYVKQTWGKRCNKLLFISSVKNESFPTIGTNVGEGRDHLTQKVLRGLRASYDQHFVKGGFHWLFYCDDDTYAILENMRHFLRDKDTDGLLYYGAKFKVIVKDGYMSGGGGMTIGREALRRLFAKNSSTCFNQQHQGADYKLGMCLGEVGVKPGNSTDILGRSRFHALDISSHIGQRYPKWYYEYDANGAKGGLDWVSDCPITFHYTRGTNMLVLEYAVYHLHALGLAYRQESLNTPSERTALTNSTRSN